MPVVLDPDAAAVYKAFQEAGRPPYETLTAPEAREFYMAARFVSNPDPPELQSVEPLSIPAPYGAIPARIYTPSRGTWRGNGGTSWTARPGTGRTTAGPSGSANTATEPGCSPKAICVTPPF